MLLGILASSICFVLWNKVILHIGTVKSNNFIYLIPLITMITSAIMLKEIIKSIAGMGGYWLFLEFMFQRIRIKLLVKNAIIIENNNNIKNKCKKFAKYKIADIILLYQLFFVILISLITYLDI